MRSLAALSALCCLAAPATAATPNWLTRGQVVTSHLPGAACEPRPTQAVFGRDRVICSIEVVGERVRVGGREDWQSLGPSPREQLTVEAWKWRKRAGEGVLECYLQPGLGVEFRVAAPTEEEAQALLARVVTAGPRSNKAAQAAFDSSLGPFADALLPASLVPDAGARRALVAGATRCPGASRVQVDTYREAQWFAVHFLVGPVVYNDLQVRQPERSADGVARIFLPCLREIGEALAASPANLPGVRLWVQLGHKDFLRPTEVHAFDVLEAYFPATFAVQFARDEVTGQALVDGSIVLVNGNRTAVTLDQAIGN